MINKLLEITGTSFKAVDHFFDRYVEREMGTWEDIVSDLKGIKTPKRGVYKIITNHKCYVTEKRRLITAYSYDTGGIEGVVVAKSNK